MKTALTVLTTVVLTTIAIFAASQGGIFPLGGKMATSSSTSTPSCVGDAIVLDDTGSPCTTPWGEVVDHGVSVLSFGEPTELIPGGKQTCESKTVTCDNGKRYRDIQPLTNQYCGLEPQQHCEVNGFMFADGTSKTFYTQGSLVNGEWTCGSQERTCDNGKVNGDDTYMFISCHSSCKIIEEPTETPTQPSAPSVPLPTNTPPAQPTPQASVTSSPTTNSSTTTLAQQPDSVRAYNCPSPRGGSSWEDGRTATAYLQSAVLEGDTCPSIEVTCAYGSIRYGTPESIGEPVTENLYASCGIREPYGCTSLCGSINDGESIDSFVANGVRYSSSETCSDLKVTSYCDDGALFPAPGDFCVCETLPPADCTAPGDIQLPHGNSLTLYEQDEVQAEAGDGADTCLRQWRTCVDGTWMDVNGNPSNFTYTYPSCTVLPPTG